MGQSSLPPKTKCRTGQGLGNGVCTVLVVTNLRCTKGHAMLSLGMLSAVLEPNHC